MVSTTSGFVPWSSYSQPRESGTKKLMLTASATPRMPIRIACRLQRKSSYVCMKLILSSDQPLQVLDGGFVVGGSGDLELLHWPVRPDPGAFVRPPSAARRLVHDAQV